MRKQGQELITISCMIYPLHKKAIKQWAEADERSYSYIMRKLIDDEIKRRAARQPTPKPTTSTQTT